MEKRGGGDGLGRTFGADAERCDPGELAIAKGSDDGAGHGSCAHQTGQFSGVRAGRRRLPRRDEERCSEGVLEERAAIDGGLHERIDGRWRKEVSRWGSDGRPINARLKGMSDPQHWPSLPLDQWQDTYSTLHLWTQIVGKIRMTLSP